MGKIRSTLRIPGILALTAALSLTVSVDASAQAQEGKFDVKGGFFQKNAATDGLIEGSDLGGRARRNLSSTKPPKTRLRGRANAEGIRNGLLGLGAGSGASEHDGSQAPKSDSFAIVPAMDDKGLGAAPDSFAYPNTADPQSGAGQQAAGGPSSASPDQPDAGSQAINEGRSEEILQAVQQSQETVRALPPGSPAPGTPEYTQRLIEQVKGESEWRDRSAERRRDVTGNRF